METTLPTTPPKLQPVSEVHFTHPEKRLLSNGVEVYEIHSEDADVVRLEAVYPGGRSFEPSSGVAAATAKLMSQGAGKYSAPEIAEAVERYGASFKVRTGFDFVTVGIHSLNRHLDNLLPIARAILEEATFPQEELDTYVSNTRQRLRIQEEKNDYLADAAMRKALFGEQHPYGYRTTASVLESLDREILLAHHRESFVLGKPFVIAAGNISTEVRDFMDALFGGSDTQNHRQADRPEAQPAAERIIHQQKADSVQSAIRFAKPIIAKDHPDYPAFFVLNTLFGGFFGSRLMSNIREDKGYTYGIYSGITHLQGASYLYISSEVGIDVAQAAIKEVYYELARLRNEPISPEELELVRNYMLGSILGSVDGPFRTADTVRGIRLSNLPMDHIQTLVDTIQRVEAVELQELANRYLTTDNMLELAVGWPEE